jgi:Flp pilus assembly protein TadB
LLFVHIIIILAVAVAVAVAVVVRLVMRSWLVIALVVCVFGVSVAVGYSGSAQEHRDLERLNEIFDKFRAFAAAPLTQTAPDPAQFQNGTRTHTHTHTHTQ